MGTSFRARRRFEVGACGLAALCLVACSGDDSSPPGAPPTCPEGTHAEATGCVPDPGSACPEGMVAAPDGPGCDVVLPPGPCPAGTAPRVGSADCQPVGPSSCSAGFAPAPGGWGCDPILSDGSCSGATMMVLGETSCRPIGDCSAAFPPPEATLFVDDDFGPPDLDATHFATIAQALAAAPAGATIAVEAGSYPEALVATDDVTIVGRCADQVIVQSVAAEAGLAAQGALDVTLRGVTLQGHTPGVVALAGATVTIDRCLVVQSGDVGLVSEGSGTRLIARDSAVRSGVTVSSPYVAWGASSQVGGEMELERVEISDHLYNGIGVASDGARVTLKSSVVRGTAPVMGEAGAGIAVDAAELVVESSAILDVAANGIAVQRSFASRDASVVTITDSVVRGAKLSGNMVSGAGVHARDGSRVTVSGSDISLNDQAGVVSVGTDTKVSVSKSVVREGQPDADGFFGLGVAAYEGAELEVADTALVGNRAYGVQIASRATAAVERCLVAGTTLDDQLGRAIDVQLGGHLDLTDSALVSNATFGVAVYSESDDGTRANAVVTRTLVADTLPLPRGVEGPGGLDWFGRGVGAWDGARVEVTGSALLANHEVGFFVSPTPGNVTGAPSEGVVRSSIVRFTRPTPSGSGGVGIYAEGPLTVEQTTLVDNHAAGVLVIGAEAKVTDCFVRATHEWAEQDTFGHGVVATTGARLTLSRTDIRTSERIGVAFGASSGIVESCLVANNQIGIHAQEGSLLLEVEATPAMLGPLDVAVTSDTRFVDNVTRVGTGVIPLPATLGTGP